MAALLSACKSVPTQYKHPLLKLMVPVQKLHENYAIKKTNALFIIHVRTKGPFKSYTVVQKWALQLQKWAWHMHTELL